MTKLFDERALAAEQSCCLQLCECVLESDEDGASTVESIGAVVPDNSRLRGSLRQPHMLAEVPTVPVILAERSASRWRNGMPRKSVCSCAVI